MDVCTLCKPKYLASCSNCSSREAILASRAAIVLLNLDFTAPSISCSLLLSSLFCLSNCCLAFSFFCAVARSVASSLFSCSACKGKNGCCQKHCVLSGKIRWWFMVAVLQIYFQSHRWLSLEYKQSDTCAVMSSTCCTAFLMRSLIVSMLLCSSSSSSSSWAILASRRRFSSCRSVL